MLLLPSVAREARYSAPLNQGSTKGETLKYLAGAAALASAFVLAGVAAADTTGDVLTLYPVGGGQDTYAAWKAQEGRPDSQGTANQALYLQHLSNAPAAAHVTGLEGTKVTLLVSLSYEHRVPGTCTKTDPGGDPAAVEGHGCARRDDRRARARHGPVAGLRVPRQHPRRVEDGAEDVDVRGRQRQRRAGRTAAGLHRGAVRAAGRADSDRLAVRRGRAHAVAHRG